MSLDDWSNAYLDRWAILTKGNYDIHDVLDDARHLFYRDAAIRDRDPAEVAEEQLAWPQPPSRNES